MGGSGGGRRRTQSALPWVLLAGAPGVGTAIVLLWLGDYGPAVRWSVTLGLAGSWIVLALVLKTRLQRPLHIVANLLAALRQGDYSIRARGAGTNNPLALTFHEVNELEALLRSQRLDAAEASGSLRHVLDAVGIAVFAFDEQQCLRLVNHVGEHLVGLSEPDAQGKTATDIGLSDTLTGAAPRTIERNDPTGVRRWQVRRSAICLAGRRLTLVVLTDLSSALREEERETWRRLVRVLSHEINNSLTPIKSIVASIRTILRQDPLPADWSGDVERGLEIVSGRAEGLERFMSAYARLARLPPPNLVEVDLADCMNRVAKLETRMTVAIQDGPAGAIRIGLDRRRGKGARGDPASVQRVRVSGHRGRGQWSAHLTVSFCWPAAMEKGEKPFRSEGLRKMASLPPYELADKSVARPVTGTLIKFLNQIVGQ